MYVNFSDKVIVTEFTVALNHNFVILPEGNTELKRTSVIGCTDSQRLVLG